MTRAMHWSFGPRASSAGRRRARDRGSVCTCPGRGPLGRRDDARAGAGFILSAWASVNVLSLERSRAPSRRPRPPVDVAGAVDLRTPVDLQRRPAEPRAPVEARARERHGVMAVSQEASRRVRQAHAVATASGDPHAAQASDGQSERATPTPVRAQAHRRLASAGDPSPKRRGERRRNPRGGDRRRRDGAADAGGDGAGRRWGETESEPQSEEDAASAVVSSIPGQRRAFTPATCDTARCPSAVEVARRRIAAPREALRRRERAPAAAVGRRRRAHPRSAELDRPPDDGGDEDGGTRSETPRRPAASLRVGATWACARVFALPTDGPRGRPARAMGGSFERSPIGRVVPAAALAQDGERAAPASAGGDDGGTVHHLVREGGAYGTTDPVRAEQREARRGTLKRSGTRSSRCRGGGEDATRDSTQPPAPSTASSRTLATSRRARDWPPRTRGPWRTRRRRRGGGFGRRRRFGAASGPTGASGFVARAAASRPRSSPGSSRRWRKIRRATRGTARYSSSRRRWRPRLRRQVADATAKV